MELHSGCTYIYSMLSRFSPLIGIALLFLSSLGCAPSHPDEKFMQVIMRDIGNEVLWSIGDSTSRVLPVKKRGETYLINFEKQFSIDYDSLVSIVSMKMKANGVNRFHVQLVDCNTADVFLAFAVNSPESANTPCLGRETPETCYQIEITPKWEAATIRPILPLVLLLGVFIALYLFLKRKPGDKEESVDNSSEAELLSLGKYIFDVNEKQLILKGSTTPLTEKEARLLSLLASNPNQTLSRENILDEIWGEEGVQVISRNIDVLVSKLRKKLKEDDSISIENVHGVGYKLILTDFND